MAVTFHILRSGGRFEDKLDTLNDALGLTARGCERLLDLPDIDVVVMAVPYVVIPRLGINGMSYDQHQIVLYLDPDHPHLVANLAQTVRSILAHELHHCARAAARGTSHADTYGGSLIAEGLACCFEEEIGQPTPFYAVDCSGAALRRFAEKAIQQVQTKRQDMPGHWNDWMFGRSADDPDFPYQCGYSTGYAVVKAWLRQENRNASEAAGVDEATILDQWRDGRLDIFSPPPP